MKLIITSLVICQSIICSCSHLFGQVSQLPIEIDGCEELFREPAALHCESDFRGFHPVHKEHFQ